MFEKFFSFFSNQNNTDERNMKRTAESAVISSQSSNAVSDDFPVGIYLSHNHVLSISIEPDKNGAYPEAKPIKNFIEKYYPDLDMRSFSPAKSDYYKNPNLTYLHTFVDGQESSKEKLVDELINNKEICLNFRLNDINQSLLKLNNSATLPTEISHEIATFELGERRMPMNSDNNQHSVLENMIDFVKKEGVKTSISFSAGLCVGSTCPYAVYGIPPYAVLSFLNRPMSVAWMVGFYLGVRQFSGRFDSTITEHNGSFFDTCPNENINDIVPSEEDTCEIQEYYSISG